MEKKRSTVPFTISRRPIFVRREWFHVALLTVLMTAAWIAVGVALSLFSSTIPAPLQRRLQQVSLDLDEGVLEELRTQRQFPGGPLLEERRVILRTTKEGIQRVATQAAESAPLLTVTPTGGPSS